MWLVDDLPAAADDARADAIGPWPRDRFMTIHWEELTARLHVHLYRGEGQAGLAHFERQWRGLKRSFLLGIHPVRVEAWWMRARCALSIAAGGAGAPQVEAVAAARRDARRIRRERVGWTAGLAHLLEAGACAATRDLDGAARELRRAVTELAAADLTLVATAARWRLGELLAGDEGAALRGGAEAWLRGQGVVAPARWVEMLAPGFAAQAT